MIDRIFLIMTLFIGVLVLIIGGMLLFTWGATELTPVKHLWAVIGGSFMMVMGGICCNLFSAELILRKSNISRKGGGEKDVRILDLIEIVLADEGVKLDDVQALVRFAINFPTKWEEFMADMTKFNEAQTKLQADVAALIAAFKAVDQPAVDAATAALGQMSADIEAAMPAAPAPAPEQPAG
jgi:hypothetical protein